MTKSIYFFLLLAVTISFVTCTPEIKDFKNLKGLNKRRRKKKAFKF